MAGSNPLYLLIGGTKRLVSDNSIMSRLMNVKPTSKEYHDLPISDLVNWKHVWIKTESGILWTSEKLMSLQA